MGWNPVKSLKETGQKVSKLKIPTNVNEAVDTAKTVYNAWTDPAGYFQNAREGIMNIGKTPSAPTADTSGIASTNDAVKAQVALANQLAAQRAATPTVAPVVTAPQGSTATVDPNQFGQVNSAGYTGPQAGQEFTTIAPGTGTIAPTGDMTAAQIGNVNAVRGANIAPVTATNAAQVGQVANVAGAETSAATLDAVQQQELRNKQLALANALEGQAAGTAPSLAELQLKEGSDRAIKTQMALAANAHGNPALAARTAAINIAEAEQGAARDAAALRIQEQNQAQQLLGNVLGSARTTDVDVAKTQAQLDQEAGIKGAEFTQQANLANQSTGLQKELTQAELQQQANVATAAATNNRGVEQAKLKQEATLNNQQAQLQVALQQAQLEQDANKVNKIQADMKAIEQAKNDLVEAQFNAEAFNRAAEWDKTLSSQEKQFNETIKADLSKFSTGQMNAMETANMEAKLKSDIANQMATLQAKGMDDAAIASMLGLSQEGLTSILNAETGMMQATLQSKMAKYQAQNGMMGGLLSAGATIGAAYLMSDKTKKKAISSLEAKTLDAFLDALNGYEFEYKDQEAPGTAKGKRFGIMIQDMESNPIGESLVEETKDGKMINVGQGLGAALAAVGHLHHRLNELEGDSGKVPGKAAKENGDYSKDLVDVKVQPGEIIVPPKEAADVTGKKAMAFVKAIHEAGEGGTIEARNESYKAAFGGLSTEEEKRKSEERRGKMSKLDAITPKSQPKDIGEGISSAVQSLANAYILKGQADAAKPKTSNIMADNQMGILSANGGKVSKKSMDIDHGLQKVFEQLMKAKKRSK